MKATSLLLSKVIDTFRSRPFVFAAIFIFVPILFILHYIVYPGSYGASLRVRFSPSYLNSEDRLNPQGSLMGKLTGTGLFSADETAILKNSLEMKPESDNTFVLKFHSSDSSSLSGLIGKTSRILTDKIGVLTRVELTQEKERLKGLLAGQTGEKEAVENYLKTIDEKQYENDRTFIEKSIEELTGEISSKGQQLALIEEKLSGLDGKRDPSTYSLFLSKRDSLKSLLSELDLEKGKLLAKKEKFDSASQEIEKSIRQILALEQSVAENSKRLAVLEQIDLTAAGDSIAIPYMYRAEIVPSPKTVTRSISMDNLKKRGLIGISAALAVIFLVILYSLFVDPVISTVEELAKSVKVPVLGVISNIKKKSK